MAKITIPTSGLWSNIVAMFNSMFTEVYAAEHFGVYDYNDLATATTPISVPNTYTYVDLTNDENGTYTNKTYALTTVTDVWDSATNTFDWSGLELGDTVDIRLDIEVTTTSPNQLVDIDLEMASGSGGSYDILFFKGVFKNAGANDVNRFNSIYMGDLTTRDNPAKFKIRSDDTASVVVRGWYVRVNKRNPL